MIGDVHLEFVMCAHGASSRFDFNRSVLLVLQRRIAADVGIVIGAAGPGPGMLGVESTIVARTTGAWDRYRQELGEVFDDAERNGGVSVDADVLGSCLPRTELYRDFISPHDGRCTLLGLVGFKGRRLATIALGRKRRGFSQRDRDELRRCLPVLGVCEHAFQHRPMSDFNLTPRESEVLDLLRLGYSNGEIARGLGSSKNTVRNQLGSVFRKLDVSTRAEAVAVSLGHHERQ